METEMRVYIWSDGAAMPNGGPAGAGYVVVGMGGVQSSGVRRGAQPLTRGHASYRSAPASNETRHPAPADPPHPGELSRLSGISERTIQRLEQGEVDNPPIRYITNLAKALDCDFRDV
jgi:hypothetical protein